MGEMLGHGGCLCMGGMLGHEGILWRGEDAQA